jgi:hypothetical protein
VPAMITMARIRLIAGSTKVGQAPAGTPNS